MSALKTLYIDLFPAVELHVTIYQGGANIFGTHIWLFVPDRCVNQVEELFRREWIPGQTEKCLSWSWVGWKGQVWYDDRIVSYQPAVITKCEARDSGTLELETCLVSLEVGTNVTHFDAYTEHSPVFQRRPIAEKELRLDILDRKGFQVGYISISTASEAEIESLAGVHDFVLISQAFTGIVGWREGDYLLGQESYAADAQEGEMISRSFPKKMRRKLTPKSIASKYCMNTYRDGYDTSAYPHGKWCLLNVLMVEWKNNIAYRQAVGQIHMEAFYPARKATVLLG